MDKLSVVRIALQEANFYQYSAVVLFKYNVNDDTMGAEKLAEMVRAIPGVTRVSTASLNKEKGIAIFNVKLISQKPPKDAFIAMKKNAIKKFAGSILQVKIGSGTIEKKNFVK